MSSSLSLPSSSKTMTSSTEKTAKARAIWPAKYVRSSADCAFPNIDPERQKWLVELNFPKVFDTTGDDNTW